jgi:putative addiction module component (TIGR02574 family)
MSKQQLLEQVLILSPEERAELIEDIWVSLEQPTQEWEKRWGEVAMRRHEDLKSGKVKGIPYEEVMNEVKSRNG